MKNKKNNTPAFATWLASRFIDEKLLEELLGDLEEAYQERLLKGRVYATLMYWVDVIHLLWGFSSAPRRGKQNSTTMTGHYLQTFLRNAVRNKVHSSINILSLVVGMGACLVICQYIYFELTYDRFHHDYANTYRVIIEEVNTDLKETSPSIGYSFAEMAKREVPGIKEFMREQRFNRGAIVTNPANQLVFHEDVNDLFFVDRSFFQMFNFPLKQGNPASLFDDKYNVVITEKTAVKYFGTEDPIGKTLKIDGPPSPGVYTVSGVLNDLPLNSHLQFDFLAPMENYIELGWNGAVKERGGWNGFSVISYLSLDESANPDLVRQKLNELIARHESSDIKKNVILQPVADIYMRSNIYSDAGFINTLGNMQNIRIFSIISILILLIAWANYINLSTARSMLRAKEVGVRKSVGAFRRQVMSQFLMESLLVNGISALFAIAFAFLILPSLNAVIGKEIQFTLLKEPMFWAWFAATILIGSLLSGLYPAFVLSSFKPISMLRGNKTDKIGNVSLRKGLVVFQFLTSLLLISGTYLVYKQTSFIKGQRLSADLEKILVLRTQQGAIDSAVAQLTFTSFGNAMLERHMISSITGSTVKPGQFGVNPYRGPAQSESVAPYSRSIFAGVGFSETYDLKFVAGNPFTDNMNADNVVIINASAVPAFGFDSPEHAIGQKLFIADQQKTIVGVVENFNWHSLKESHMPYVIGFSEVRQNPYVSLKMNMSDFAGTLEQIESTFRSFYPDQPFDYFFADDAFNKQYQSEIQFGKIFLSFAALAIFIACAGLFALVSFSTISKVKEIGVRKILGADVSHLVLLLSKEYAILICVATLIAIPVVWYVGNLWLTTYATRISTGMDLFAVPVVILVVVTALTVSQKVFVTARTNPVDSLRKE